MASTFRFAAERVFLTYSDLPLKFKPQVLLTKISAKMGVKDYLISQERHLQGRYHLHAYFKFETICDTKDQAFFDVDYYSKPRHPNIQSVKGRGAPYKLYRYILKDPVSKIGNIEDVRPPWQRILEDSQSEDEFLLELMWKLNRIDNYAGYRTFRDLARRRFERPEIESFFKKRKSEEN